MAKAQTALHIAEKMVPGVGIKACPGGLLFSSGWLDGCSTGQVNPQGPAGGAANRTVGFWMLGDGAFSHRLLGGIPLSLVPDMIYFFDIRQGIESV